MTLSRDKLLRHMESILNFKAGQDDFSDRIKEVYAEAKADGFDKTALGQAIAIVRKRYRDGAIKCDKRDALIGQYLAAYEGKSEIGTINAPPALTHTHEKKSASPPAPEPVEPPPPAVVVEPKPVEPTKPVIAAPPAAAPAFRGWPRSIPAAMPPRKPDGPPFDDLEIPAALRRTDAQVSP